MFARQPPNLSVTYECRHLIALSIHFPMCRMGTTLLGQKGRGVSAEPFEVRRDLQINEPHEAQRPHEPGVGQPALRGGFVSH